LHRSYGIHHSARLGLWKNKVWNSACCAVGFSGVGIEDVFDDSNLKINENGSLLGALNNNNESSSASFETLDSEITPETTNFFVSDAEGDPDCPSKGYSSIEQALNALSQGKVGWFCTISRPFCLANICQCSNMFRLYRLFLGVIVFFSQ